jgi:hypothetical protein
LGRDEIVFSKEYFIMTIFTILSRSHRRALLIAGLFNLFFLSMLSATVKAHQPATAALHDKSAITSERIAKAEELTLSLEAVWKLRFSNSLYRDFYYRMP